MAGAGAGGSEAAPELIDLMHMGREHVIGAWLVGDVIVDPGPASCLARLLGAIGDRPLRAIALTHIHLDHAGATGSLVRERPELEVWVHERGAPHLADPGRLLASAQRLYGDRMESLWGEVAAVPEEHIRTLAGGERIDAFEVAYTPGHASHHVSYLHEPTGWAFTGDVAGVRIGDGATLAPTPPPDIDLVAWRASLETVEGWHPRALAVTHFGVHEDVAAQLEDLRSHLVAAERLAEAGDEHAFNAAMRARAAAGRSGEEPGSYEQAMQPGQSYAGLRRWLERR